MAHQKPPHAPASPPDPTTMENYLRLGTRMQRFVEARARGLGWHECARLIRPRSRDPRKLGWKYGQIPVVAAAIAEYEARAMENAGITSTRTWLEVARIAYFDHRKLCDKDGNPIPLHLLDEDTVAGIAGIDIEELFTGRGEERTKLGDLKKYRAWNKVDALKMILLAKKELVERHEFTGKDGARLHPASVDDLTDDELAAIAARGRAAPAEPSPSSD